MLKIDKDTDKTTALFLLVPTSLLIKSVQWKICNNKQDYSEANNYTVCIYSKRHLSRVRWLLDGDHNVCVQRILAGYFIKHQRFCPHIQVKRDYSEITGLYRLQWHFVCGAEN